MKILTTILIIAAPVLHLSAQKVGYLNTQEVLAMMPELKEANSNLEVMKTMFSKKGQEMLQSLQQKYGELQQKQAAGEIAPVELEKQSAQLKVDEEALRQFESESQQKMVAKSEELLKPIQEKVDAAIRAVATENGYSYIIDNSQGTILYADPSSNVIDLIKTKLGLK